MRRYWVFLREDGTVRSKLKTKGDHSTNPAARELSAIEHSTILSKKEENGGWVDLQKEPNHITKQEFFDLFAPTQLEDIIDSTHKKVKLWVFRIGQRDSINTQSELITGGLAKLEDPLGLLGTGEANRITTAAQELAGV